MKSAENKILYLCLEIEAVIGQLFLWRINYMILLYFYHFLELEALAIILEYLLFPLLWPYYSVAYFFAA